MGTEGGNCNFGGGGQGGVGSDQKSEGEKNQPQGDLGKGIPGSEESMCKGPGDSKCKDPPPVWSEGEGEQGKAMLRW